MGAHVGLLPDRTPLWRLFPLPGTTTRRLSPQKHPSDPPCRPSGCGGLPLASSQQHGQLDLWAGRAGNKTNLDWWRVTDSTHRPHRAPCCVTARAGSSSSHPRAIDGRRPSSPPHTAMHNFRLGRQTTRWIVEGIQRCREYYAHGHERRTPAFPRGFFFRYRTQKRPTTQSVVREILV